MMRFFKLFIFLFITAGLIYGGENFLIKLAVLDVTSRKVMKEVDRLFLTERIQIELSKYKGLTIVERIELKRIIDEQKLQLSGMAEKDAVKIGNLIGADKIVTGSLTEVDGSFFLTVKVIDVSTSELDFIDQVSGENVNDLNNRIKILAEKIAKALLKTDRVLSKEEHESVTSNYEMYWFPVGVCLVPGIQLPFSYVKITGLNFNFIGGYDKVYGISYGIINLNKETYGIQQGYYNFSEVKLSGIQIGFINNAYEVIGVQIGFLNFANKLTGVQFGFLNFIKTGFLPVMIGINASF